LKHPKIGNPAEAGLPVQTLTCACRFQAGAVVQISYTLPK